MSRANTDSAAWLTYRYMGLVFVQKEFNLNLSAVWTQPAALPDLQRFDGGSKDTPARPMKKPIDRLCEIIGILSGLGACGVDISETESIRSACRLPPASPLRVNIHRMCTAFNRKSISQG